MADAQTDWETAVALAQEQIRLCMDDVTHWSRPTVDAYRSFLRNDRFGYLSTGRLLELQRELERHQGAAIRTELHEEIMGYAEAMLREGTEMPPWLSRYTADVLASSRESLPPEDSGAAKRQRRDIGIRLAILRLVREHKWPAYWSDSIVPSDRQTACEVVAEALAREGISGRLSTGSVIRIWKNTKPIVEHKPDV